jgi:hypothetical protein
LAAVSLVAVEDEDEAVVVEALDAEESVVDDGNRFDGGVKCVLDIMSHKSQHIVSQV